MAQATRERQSVQLTVRNIGGISDTSVEFEPGVNVLSGRNATNRTSLLRSIMTVLGSDDASLKSDAEEGFVELQFDDETYTRRFTRENGTVTSDGEPYLDDPELGDLYAFLLATNESRQAVLTDQNLRDLIMRPVDTAAIKSEIDTLEQEKSRIDDELDELSQLEQRLPALEDDRADLSTRIEEKEAALEAKREEIETADASVDESREEERELDERMSELGDVRSEIDSVRQELRAQRESLETLRAEREELERDAEELPDAPAGEIEEINRKIDDLRDRKQSIQSEMNTLQRIIQFNEDNLEGTSSDILDALTEDGGHDHERDVTEQLVDDSETVVCWTCGHGVEQEAIEETLEELRELRTSKLSESRDLDEQIDDLKEERITYEEKERQRNQVQDRLERTASQIEEREGRIDDLEDRRDSLEAEIDDIEAEIDELQTQQDETILSLHKEANQLEVDLNRLETEREEVSREIEDIETTLEERAELEQRREELTEELEDLRTRIDQIEAEAVESFNDQMEAVLDALAYDNIARIWIERTVQEVKKGRRKVSENQFTLHIVRESESGAAYEDELRHLSESEREVTGLVFALAGYLVHDVHEEVPFMLLDSLEAIDSDRIARLVEHFEPYPQYLVAALLPEDAAATSDSYNLLTEI
ncbi:chromosome segregation protein SMC [Halorubellus sp. JP-L1]|uniref:archaea-specific SMC-related protein n=1 Tax=Halorubellus sp. JP-L1 TaxID=2715753 RepID=UPI0014085E73|nr:archaea-specific SMC-related protein [Halorubellus sp. JP-L1]NHN42934.1 chromosome segregation protein SMC [Halorubellus sp. JP-L1]